VVSKLGDEAEPFMDVQTTSDQAHQAQQAQKIFVRAVLRTMAQKAVKPLSGLRSSGIS
jgi:hypothetical protein